MGLIEIMNHIAHIRAFNRDYTVRLGLLDKSYLGSGQTLTQIRVLQEVFFAGNEGVSARDIALRINADEGYMSRILKGFETKGWLERKPDVLDARRKLLTLTETGQAVYEPLSAASAALIEDMTGHLEASGRKRLCEALTEVQRLLEDRPLNIRIRGLESGDLGWITEAHGRIYATEEGYDLTFEALVARILADFVVRPHRNDTAFIAVDEVERRMGSTFVVHEDEETMRLRLVLLEPEARGLGLGKRMLKLALDHAKAKGYRKMILWTHKSLQAAGHLYQKAGFEMIEEMPSQSFGLEVVEQVWEKTLA